VTDPYLLAIDIDEADLPQFRASARSVIVAKSLGNARPNVAWLAWTPLARNIVSWDESYGVYAAETASFHGGIPRVVALVQPARDGCLYAFSGDAFGAPSAAPGIVSGHYDVRNDATFAASFGLVQGALVNGTPILAPLHGVALPPGLTADFTQGRQVYVWAEKGLASGAVIATIPPDAAIITFEARRNTARYCYDRVAKAFRPSSGTAGEVR
jgi:hypothetical protein